MLADTGGSMLFENSVGRFPCTLVLLLFLTCKGLSQEEYGFQPVRIMFYNVENLFDYSNDSLKDDDDFLPEGVMRWNYSRYSKKIASLYKTIVAAGGWSPPAIAAFCEVENRRVLEDLVYGTWLSKYDWGIIHEDSPDERGIDVCLIYRKDIARLIDFKYRIPTLKQNAEFLSRSVLFASFEILTDTIHVIVNHWPSRRGGVLAGEDLRIAVSEMVKAVSDSVSDRYSGKAKIIIGGDFNCTPHDLVILKMTGQSGSVNNKLRPKLINLTDRFFADGSGTYRYLGIWEMIDQVIVSDWLLKCTNGLYTDNHMFTIFKPEFLLKKDPRYPGLTPFSTYRGYRFQGGFSDHLPVLVDLGFR